MSREPKPTHKVRFAETAGDRAKNPDAVRPGAKPGRPRPEGSGKKKGQKNASTVEREATLAEALAAEFNKLTKAEIEEITPAQVMRLCTLSAVKIGNWGLALMASEKWAPYVHPRLAAVVHHEGGRAGRDIDGETGEDVEEGGDPGLRVRILGGLPELAPARSTTAQEAEVVGDKDAKDDG